MLSGESGPDDAGQFVGLARDDNEEDIGHQRGDKEQGGGDLHVRVHVGRHPLFTRRKNDLRITIPVTFTEAALGADVTVPTLDGQVTLRIPAGSDSGKTFRIKGKGVPTAKKGTGDLLATIEVAVPNELDDETRRLLEELKERESEDVRAHLGVT